MKNKINILIKEINEIRKDKNPVHKSWLMSCKKLGFNKLDHIVVFGLMFIKDKNLLKNENAYHNEIHAADAVICAATLLKEEFSLEELKTNGPILLLAMLFHDISHNGKNNEYDYQLEQEAIKTLNLFINKNLNLNIFWEKKLKINYGELKEFFGYINEIILGTDFKNGPIENIKNYNNNNNGLIKINKLKMLANEADILPSCISSLGPELGLKLAKEQHNVNISSWKHREYFLEKLAIFGSNASNRIGIQSHIDNQLKTIKQYSSNILDNKSKNGNFLLVAEEVNKNLI